MRRRISRAVIGTIPHSEGDPSQERLRVTVNLVKKRTSENLALFVKNSGRQGFQDGHFDERFPEAKKGR